VSASTSPATVVTDMLRRMFRALRETFDEAPTDELEVFGTPLRELPSRFSLHDYWYDA
jgi:hypothetical protein